jgi:RNA polymerase sigma factor (sigma-70 family)
MRRVLVDYARARLTSKRGGGAAVLSLDQMSDRGDVEETGPSSGGDVLHELQEPPHEDCDDIAAIDESLTRLASVDPRHAQIVEMRYFGGLTVEETAAALNISTATVKRGWTLARAWLHRDLTRSG